MKIKEVLASLSFGVLVLLSGIILTSIAVSEGLLATFPEWPRWVAYLMVGGLLLTAGGASLLIGTDEAQDKMESIEERLDPIAQLERHPLFAVGASLVGGWLLSQLMVHRTKKKSNKQHRSNGVPDRSRDTTNGRNGHYSQSFNRDAKDGDKDNDSSFFDDLNDHIANIGETAGSAVTSMALHMGTKYLSQQVMSALGMDEANKAYKHGQSVEHNGSVSESSP